MTQLNRPKEAWGSRLGVILAVMGSAVGLGNFLRFPGLAAQYEGGAFMIPYFISLLILGLPLAWVEWSLGRYGGAHGHNSTPGIYRSIWKSRIAPYCGALAVIIPVMIYMYYVYIEGWCLAYSFRYLFGQMDFGDNSEAYQGFFNTFVGKGTDGMSLTSPGGWPLGSAVVFTAVCFAVNFFLIYRGLAKGIEWFCRWAMPLLILCALIILVRVLTLDAPVPAHPEQNLSNGLGYMWNLDVTQKSFWESLCNPQMWLAASGQIFFSLSVGFGIVITYASYMKKDDDIALSSLTAAAGNEFCEVVLGGMIIIPAGFIFLGQSFFEKTSSTFDLGFVALPNVFNEMPLGNFIGFLFFFLLFLAAVTSSLSMLQPAIALLEEGLGLRRKASVALLGLITAIGAAFVVFFSKNLLALSTIDFWIGTFCIYVVATFQVILFGWVLGVDRGFEELNNGAEIRIPRFVKFIIKYVSPAYLLIIFGMWIFQEFFKVCENPNYETWVQKIQGNSVTQTTLGLIASVFIIFLFVTSRSVKRWRAAEQAEKEAVK